MARTKAEILAAMLAIKENDPILRNVLTSNSKVSLYQSLFSLYAEITGDLELSFDDFIDRVQELLDTKRIYNSYWWREQALAFQLGYPLVVLSNGNLGYEALDIDAQIVKRAAIVVANVGQLLLKVAKVEGDTAEPLTESEKTAFSAYVGDIAPAGIVVRVISDLGDELKIGVKVQIDPIIINPTNGTLYSDATVKPIEDAINNNIATYQNTSFGGDFFANRLLSDILTTRGVLNATFELLEKKGREESDFIDVLALPSKSFSTYAGYVRLAEGWSLSNNIEYYE